MRFIRFFIHSLVNLYSFSANPNLFGSKKLENIAGLARTRAEGTQSQIDSLQSQNSFETAAAKAAMARASQTSKQMMNRNLNVMGGNASPEALIAAQGAVNEGLGAAAGQIAVGAEANQKAEIANLQGLKENQMGQYAEIKSDAFNQRNAMVMQLLNPIGKGLGEAAGGKILSKGGIGKAAVAASDERIKENISFIGELQGNKIHKYNFKGSPEVHIGVIAQEVEKKNPDKVVEQEGIKKVDYNSLFSRISSISKK
jgi:hypothetical protein